MNIPTTDDIVTFVTGLLQSKLGIAVVPDENLFATGAVDSVGIMQAIAAIEEHFQIQIPPSDLLPANFRTIRLTADYVARRLGSE